MQQTQPSVPELPPDKSAYQSTGVLVEPRLGVYAGLFYALRAKHPPTAAHGLRVALGCSKWAAWAGLDSPDRDLLEVAALLHDVGKIGIPDSVLQKPARLDSQERMMMEMNYDVAAEVLRGAGATDAMLALIGENLDRSSNPLQEQTIAARMLAIVDAFDSMTTEQVFRKAMSQERAIDELFANSDTQFDSELVAQFAELISKPRPELEADVASHWLTKLSDDSTPGFCQSDIPATCGAIQNFLDTVFHRRLLYSLNDAAIYLDEAGQILVWNRAAEQLTGRPASSLANCVWNKELMGLKNIDGQALSDSECPLSQLRGTNAQVSRRYQLDHIDGRHHTVNLMALPVISGQKEYAGAILLVRDASAQVDLEETVQSLNEMVATDPLTGVANRSELDRMLTLFVDEHLELGTAGAVIICDIDHFKRINDTHGHKAGDDALVTFAGILKEVARDGDLVARYGGEEFVVLCAGCDNPAATSRAEEIRRVVERTPIPSLEGAYMTASFGVTAIQLGDTEDSLVARADRALLTAKETGRNRVIQLGIGQDPSLAAAVESTGAATPNTKASWLGWFRGCEPSTLLETELIASVPHQLAVKKLSGFVNDHHAEIMEAEDNHIVLRVDGSRIAGGRTGERPSVLLMEIDLKPVEVQAARSKGYQKKTEIKVTIRPVKPRDRRVDGLRAQASRLLASFNSYLMSQVITEEMRDQIIELRS